MIVVNFSLSKLVPATSLKEFFLDSGSLTADSLAASSLTKAVVGLSIRTPILNLRSIGLEGGYSTALDLFINPGKFVYMDRMSSSVAKRSGFFDFDDPLSNSSESIN